MTAGPKRRLLAMACGLMAEGRRARGGIVAIAARLDAFAASAYARVALAEPAAKRSTAELPFPPADASAEPGGRRHIGMNTRRA